MAGTRGSAKRLGAVVLLTGFVWVASPGAVSSGTLSMRATLSIRATLTACPATLPARAACYSHAGAGAVSGLGAVSQTYTNVVDTAPPGCPVGSFALLPTTVHLSVAGKGALTLDLSENSTCSDSLGVLDLARAFTITGGSGSLAGAAGGGHVKHAASLGSAETTGRDTYSGTLVVPGLVFDTIRPRLRGARSKTFVTPRRATSMRVAFRVTAYDDHDGPIPTACSPRSGSRFRLGTTRVHCSATDSSANTATASFTVAVKRHAGKPLAHRIRDGGLR